MTLLEVNQIQTLVDVRTVPRSKRNPQFNSGELQASLKNKGIEYVWNKGLGGLRRPNPDSANLGWRNPSFMGYSDYMQGSEFEENLESLVRLALMKRTAMMCAEAVPWRCHRSLISDALTVRGFEVLHITSESPPKPHKLTPFAKVEGLRISYPAD